MDYHSTRDAASRRDLSGALGAGLAPDGGLFVPSELPRFAPGDFAACWRGAELDAAELAAVMLAPFFSGDKLERHMPDICRGAFSFPLPLKDIGDDTALLELFHGPTAAFKDVGARFLARAFERMPPDLGAASDHVSALKRLILVATSGDTGGAVAAAFHGAAHAAVALLFPRGGVSPTQERQLTCWDGNVLSLRVRGTFDDCQALVKSAFASPEWRRFSLSSANSINIARLLPQTVYYAKSSLEYLARHGKPPGVIVPTGNLGNGLAALWAKHMGFPIRELVFAVNANRTLADFAAGQPFAPRPSLKTLANAMDVGNPSNFERLSLLHPDAGSLATECRVVSVSDDMIRETIRNGVKRWGKVFCPHTATAVYAREEETTRDWIVVATAHPAKFPEIVEPLIGGKLSAPPALAALLDRRTIVTDIEADLAAMLEAVARFVAP